MGQTESDQYRENFEQLKRRVEFFRILLRESGVLAAEMDVSVIDELRGKLIKAFKNKKTPAFHKGKDACHCCHYASAPNASPLRDYDIAYLLVKNPDFQLPEPDWREINKDPGSGGHYRCLMLGQKGCLFGVNRPAVCLSYVCKGAVRAILDKTPEPWQDFGYSFLRDDESENFQAAPGDGDRVLQKIGFPFDFRMGEVVGDWFYKVLALQIRQSEFGRLLKKFRNGSQEPFFLIPCLVRSKRMKEVIGKLIKNNLLISEEVKKFFPEFTKKEILEQLEVANIF
ncbi:MAG: hypothetical protein Q8P76_02625 [bacterium]|nr:hypothetical protein [bacterium]